MISIIIPFHNEAENLPILLGELAASLGDIEHEIILVNDGSDDRSALLVSGYTKKNPNIKLVANQKRLGKGRALASGVATSSGEILIFMDADLQDDPRDISKFLSKINEGYDVVNGWRRDRDDPAEKTLPSRIANGLLWKVLLKSKLHDVNCGFKAIKRNVLDRIPLYGDNYRFLPLLAEQVGFVVGEVVVNHRPRLHGRSKYGASRLVSGLLDTVTAYFIFRFAEKPLHFFGIIGALFFVPGSIASVYFIIERLFFGELLYRRPAFLLSLVFVIVGLQIILTGIVAELVVYLNTRSRA